MPIYMDLHIGQGLTAEEIALAHQMDVKIQKDYHCKCLTYWFDQERGNAFCLVEAPSKDHVFQLHRNSHTQIPDEIIEVDKRVIKVLLGRIEDPRIVEYQIEQKIKVFTDPAYRVILTIENNDLAQLSQKLNKKEAKKLLSRLDFIVKNCADKNNGAIAQVLGNSYSLSFNSNLSAPMCALDIHNFMRSELENLNFQMAIHAGNPVDDNQILFGKVLNFNNLICQIKSDNPIIISNTVYNLLKNNHNKSPFESGLIRHLDKNEESFLLKLSHTLEANWQNSLYGVENFSQDMAMSKSQLYRYCSKITGLSTNKILSNYRLFKARKLLQSTTKRIDQIAEETCFNSTSYFSKCFIKKFGFQPSQYLVN